MLNRIFIIPKMLSLILYQRLIQYLKLLYHIHHIHVPFFVFSVFCSVAFPDVCKWAAWHWGMVWDSMALTVFVVMVDSLVEFCIVHVLNCVTENCVVGLCVAWVFGWLFYGLFVLESLCEHVLGQKLLVIEKVQIWDSEILQDGFLLKLIHLIDPLLVISPIIFDISRVFLNHHNFIERFQVINTFVFGKLFLLVGVVFF